MSKTKYKTRVIIKNWVTFIIPVGSNSATFTILIHSDVLLGATVSFEYYLC